MKIAFFTDTFLPSVNGVVTVVKTSAKGLSDRGHTVAVFYPDPGGDKSEDVHVQGVQLFPVLSFPSLVYPDFRLAAPTPQTFVRLRRFRPDIIHVQAPGLIGFEGLLGGKILKTPVVGSFHTYFMEPEYLRIIKLARFKSISKALWKYAISFYNRCDAVFVHSTYMANDLTSHGLKPKKIRTLPNALDNTPIKTVSQQAVNKMRSTYKLKDKIVLYVGRLSREKNIDSLLKAFVHVSKKVRDAQLVIVGDGPIRDELKMLAGELKIEDKVVFTGSLTHDVLMSSGILQAATLFCTPSTTETQCMSVLEAMAVGLPIVGMRAMGMIDTVGTNGTLVAPGSREELVEALTMYLLSAKKTAEAGKESLNIARRHSLSNVLAQHEKVYKSLVD